MVPTQSQPATLASLPVELLLNILTYCLSATLLSPIVLVDGQFTRLCISCQTCAFRNVAGVCRTWRAIAREVVGRDVVLGTRCIGSDADEEVVKCLEENEGRALKVKTVDASLRRATFDLTIGGESSPALFSPSRGLSPAADDSFGLSRSQVRLERWHEQCASRARQRLLRLLSVCRNLTALDVDLAFFVDLRNSPIVVPLSLRLLTLRNADAAHVVALLQQLSGLEELVLRLALDCLPPPTLNIPSNKLPSLRRFELSTTAFGTTSLSFVLSLLSNSHDSLKTLTVRNKGATQSTVEAFLPVARGLIARFADVLEVLVVTDIPRGGVRAPGDGPLDWFPSRPTSFPRLRKLRLTGLALPSRAFFTHRVTLPFPASDSLSDSPYLRSLTVEDFDSPSAGPLVEALETVAALSRLEQLRVAFAKERETSVNRDDDWVGAKRAIEAWCEGEQRESGRRTRLVAGWRVVKVEGVGMW